MIKNTWKTLSLLAFCGAIVLANPADAKADEVSGPGLSSGNYIATVEAETVNISTDESGQEVLMAASRGSSFQVVEDMGDGFVKVKVKDTYGYLPVDGNATVTQTDEATIAALEAAYDAPAEFTDRVLSITHCSLWADVTPMAAVILIPEWIVPDLRDTSCSMRQVFL